MPLIGLDILARRPFADGAQFGATGAYERIDARARFALDPTAPGVADIIDIAHAPRGPDGRVHFATDVFILRPVDAQRASGAVLLELPNRGNKRVLQFFNDAPGTNDPKSAADAGNGFLMRLGHCVVVAGWQGDVLAGDGRIVLDVPVARAKDGGPLTARIKAEFIADAPGITCLPLSTKTGTRSHPTVSLDTRQAELRRRRYPWSQAEPIAADAWQFARIDGGGRGGAGEGAGGEQAIVPSAEHMHLRSGFETGWIYELIYTAKDPLVLGLGFAAVRDLVSFLRHDSSAANPLAGMAQRAYGWGRSQSGRAIREFIYRGFNADAAGRKVFDGMLPHVSGGGRLPMNRFSNLVLAASRQYEDWLHPADRFPFSYAASTDHITGATDAILKRPATDPLVIHTHTASEYWHRRGSLVHTDTQGRDLAQPDTVRVYFWASSQHWADPTSRPPAKGICQNYQNNVATSAFFRATLHLMEAWVRDRRAPPQSRVPCRNDNTLVSMATWREQFPAIPGVAVPARPNHLASVDYGRDFDEGGPPAEPPSVVETRPYAVLVPAVDHDGDDVAGLRAPMVQTPLGTYTGWNMRARGFGHGALHEFSGSYIPLPESAEERTQSDDPRTAILDRYPTREAYVAAIRAAAEALGAEGFLLAEDVERAALAAADWGRPRHAVQL